MKNDNSINLQKAIKCVFFLNEKGWFNRNWKKKKNFHQKTNKPEQKAAMQKQP